MSLEFNSARPAGRVQQNPRAAAAALAVLGALLCSAPPSHAANAALNAVLNEAPAQHSGDDFLPPDQAFRLLASAEGAERVQLHWVIATGYYLYRDRIKVASVAPDIALGAVQFPPGQVKSDDYFGKQVVYHRDLLATVPLAHVSSGLRSLALRITYQGCAEAGLCYPPITRTVSLDLPAAGASPGGLTPTGAAGSAAASGLTDANAASGAYVSEQDRLAALIRSGNMLAVLGTFFGLGLLLAFTPCVLPMVPILSGLIAGAGSRISTGRAFALSLTYVLGMAVTYTVTGAAFAAAGKQVQAAFQQPWIIILFAALFIAMALSMLGLYTVQMPGFVQTRLAEASNRQQGGRFGSVAIMGALSALIVTTCVAPPLVATLAVIGQSGAIGRGAAALFVMSLGMGAPLLVIGSSAGRWLPKAGPWMTGVKQLFGVLMLALAAWMLTRIVPARAVLLLFALPAFVAAVVLAIQASNLRSLARGTALAAAVLAGLYGVALLVGAARGSQDPLQPLARGNTVEGLAFQRIGSLADLNREVQAAAAHGQPVMLDFYADWCTSCLEMQRYTFPNSEVRTALRGARLLRADVTANTADDQALLHQFQIYGPPTIAFYDEHGHEQRAYRVVGFMGANQFAALLHRAFGAG